MKLKWRIKRALTRFKCMWLGHRLRQVGIWTSGGESCFNADSDCYACERCYLLYPRKEDSAYHQSWLKNSLGRTDA